LSLPVTIIPKSSTSLEYKDNVGPTTIDDVSVKEYIPTTYGPITIGGASTFVNNATFTDDVFINNNKKL
jgi:hypothetical protein